MMPMMLYSMPKVPRSRNRYEEREKQVLVDIVKHAEGGKYLELLLVRDMTKNLEKQEIWMKITALFSQAIGRDVPKKKVQSLWSRIINGSKKNLDGIFSDSINVAEEDFASTTVKEELEEEDLIAVDPDDGGEFSNADADASGSTSRSSTQMSNGGVDGSSNTVGPLLATGSPRLLSAILGNTAAAAATSPPTTSSRPRPSTAKGPPPPRLTLGGGVVPNGRGKRMPRPTPFILPRINHHSYLNPQQAAMGNNLLAFRMAAAAAAAAQNGSLTSLQNGLANGGSHSIGNGRDFGLSSSISVFPQPPRLHFGRSVTSSQQQLLVNGHNEEEEEEEEEEAEEDYDDERVGCEVVLEEDNTDPLHTDGAFSGGQLPLSSGFGNRIRGRRKRRVVQNRKVPVQNFGQPWLETADSAATKYFKKLLKMKKKRHQMACETMRILASEALLRRSLLEQEMRSKGFSIPSLPHQPSHGYSFLETANFLCSSSSEDEDSWMHEEEQEPEEEVEGVSPSSSQTPQLEERLLSPYRYSRRADPRELLTPSDFKSYFRLEATTVERLCDLLSTDLGHSTARGRPFSPLQQLCTALNYYAGFGWRRVSPLCGGVSQTAAFKSIRRVTEALARRQEEFIRLPNDTEMAANEEQFRARFGLPRFGCAVGGVFARFEEAPRGLPEGARAKMFQTADGKFYAINCQLVTNDREIYDLDCRWHARMSAARLWNESAAKGKLDAHLGGCFLVAAGEAYPLSEHVIVPYGMGEAAEDDSKGEFNQRLSALRDATMGAVARRWKARFPCLNALRNKVAFAQKVITATAILHNLAARWEDELPDEASEEGGKEEEEESYVEEDLMTIMELAGERQKGEAVRDELRASIQPV